MDNKTATLYMVRKATKKEEEIDAIGKLIAYGAEHHQVLSRSKQEIADNIESFFVYLEDGEILGCCALELYNKKLAEIRSLVVLPNHQGKSVGRKLIEACVSEAKEKNISEVLAITDKDAFFEKLGFYKCLDGQWPMFLRIGVKS